MAALGAISIWAAVAWGAGDVSAFTSESAGLETIHNILLGIGTILLTVCYFEARPGALKFGACVLAGVCCIGLIRELEFDHGMIPFSLPRIANISDKAWFMTPVILLVFVGVLRQRAHIREATGLAFKWRSWPLYVAGAGIAIGMLLDHFGGDEFPLSNAHLWEELTETYGYGFLIYAAIRHRELAQLEAENGPF